jgi:hypothetical protein
MLMKKAAEYHARADHAEQLASKINDPEAKQIYRDIARQWREMAEQAERYGW